MYVHKNSKFPQSLSLLHKVSIITERFFCLFFFSTTDFHVLRVGDDHANYSYSYLPAEDAGVESESDQEYA